jgi:hypothetical protein
MYYVIEKTLNGRYEYHYTGDSEGEVLQECRNEEKLTDDQLLTLLFAMDLSIIGIDGDYIHYNLHSQSEDYD